MSQEYKNEHGQKVKTIEFYLSKEFIHEINEMMDLCRCENEKDLFKKAVFAFRWMVNQVKEGRTVLSVDPNDATGFVEEFTMPSLKNVKERRDKNNF